MTTLQINQPTPQPYPTGKKTIAQATITNTPTITTPRRQHKLPKLTFQFVNPQTNQPHTASIRMTPEALSAITLLPRQSVELKGQWTRKLKFKATCISTFE